MPGRSQCRSRLKGPPMILLPTACHWCSCFLPLLSPLSQKSQASSTALYPHSPFSMSMNTLSGTVGRGAISLIAVASCTLPFIADWNETHIYNPRWTGHAKFHNGQTMSMGVALGLSSLYYLWRPSQDQQDALWSSALIGSIYWITQLSAILYPDSVSIDPEFGDEGPQMKGSVVFLSIIWSGYLLASRSLHSQKVSIN